MRYWGNRNQKTSSEGRRRIELSNLETQVPIIFQFCCRCILHHPKAKSPEKTLWAISLVKALSIQFVEFDEILWLKAAEIKGTHPISFCDAFAAATADLLDATIVTGDPEFKQLEDQLSIRWLTNKK